MRADPPDLWTGASAQRYETANYGSGLAAFVMRRSHDLVERDLGPEVHFSRVLEVGAGSGVHLQHVRHGFDEYWMTDASVDMLRLAQTSFEGRRVVTAAEDATRLSFADQSFDRVIAAHVLEHLYRPHEALREWVRVLRPGGMLSLVLPCDPGLLWRLGRHFGPRREAEKAGLPYDFIMAREHVNAITNLVAFIRYYFEEYREVWWPCRVPSSDLNLIYAVNVRI